MKYIYKNGMLVHAITTTLKSDVFVFDNRVKKLEEKACKGIVNIKKISFSSEIDEIKSSCFEDCKNLIVLEINCFSNTHKVIFIQNRTVTFESIEAESIEAESIEAESIEAESIEAESIEAEPIKPEYEGCSSNPKELYIHVDAFKNCSSLESFISYCHYKKVIIEKGAFAGCSRLRTVKLLTDEIEIHDNAFDGCDNLTLICNSACSKYLESYARESFGRVRYVRCDN